MSKTLFILCLTILLLAQPSAAVTAAEPVNLTMSTQAAFGGHFKYGEWLPIFVNVENAGSNLTGQIRVSISNQTGQLDFVTPAELPAGARKRFTLYVLPNNFSRSLEVELVHEEETLLTSKVRLSVLPNDRYVIGLIAADEAGLAALNPPLLPGRRERAETVALSLAEIPDRPAGLRLLDALILNDVDTSRLTPAQQATLKSWVAGGGRLVLGGGAGAGRTLAGLPPSLQPYADTPIRVPGPFIIAGAEPGPQATILLARLEGPAEAEGQEQNSSSETNGLPLIVEQSVGAGYVDFIALDLSQSPFDAWAGLTDFAKRLLSPGAAWPQHLPPDVSPRQMSDSQLARALTNLPALDLPSVRFVGLLLIGYIVLVGPVNYFFLRWRDRLAWAWVTIPALTLTFSGLAYGLGFSQRGSDIIVNQISVIELGPAGEAVQGRTYVGVFSPSRRAYDIEIGAGTLIRPLGEGYDPWSGSVNTPGVMSVVQAEPAQVRGLSVNQWSMQSFVAETVPAESPGLVSQMTADRESLHGRLENQGGFTWQDVVVIFNGRFQKLGDLAPGQTAEISLTLDQNSDMMMGFSSYVLFQDEFNRPGGTSREANFKQTVLDSVLFNSFQNDLPRGPFLIGWLNDSPLPVRVEDRAVSTQKTSLAYGTLPLTFDHSHIVVPPGFGQIETLALTGNASSCNYGRQTRGYYPYQGTVETKISLPARVRQIRPRQLDLYIYTDAGWAELPAVELYDQTGQEWILLEQARLGANPIPAIDRFYDLETASVQVRLSDKAANFNGGGCLFLDLAMEGERS